MAFNQPMSKIKYNNRISKFEQLARDCLLFYCPNEEVIYNHRPDWLKNPKTQRNLEIDIYFPNLKLGIEVNGAMHELDGQMYRDSIKKEKCIENGIVLISINTPKEIFKLKEIMNLEGNLPQSLYSRIMGYPTKKKHFGKLGKILKHNKRNKENKIAQEREREFNKQKMLRSLQ